MSSVKKMKSKSRGRFGVAESSAEDNPDYHLRRRAFADSPPSKMVRPLRALRRQAAESFEKLRLAHRVANGDESAEIVKNARADLNYWRVACTVARRLADRGDGTQVHNFTVRMLS